MAPINNWKRILGLPLEVPVLPSGKRDRRTLVVEELGHKYVETCYSLYKGQGMAGRGVGINEFPTLQVFERKIFKHSDGVFGVFDKGSKELLGVFNIEPSPLCRSSNPLLNAGFVVIVKSGQNLGSILYVLYCTFSHVMGYMGSLGRQASSNAAIKWLTRKFRGAQSLGTIPYSVNIKDIGWTNDEVEYSDFGYMFMGEYKPPDLVKLQHTRPQPPEPRLEVIKPDTWWQEFQTVFVRLHDGTVAVLQKASHEHKLQVEQSIRSAARRGDRFGLDEFTAEGLHNRKFFQKSVTLVLLSPTGSLIGYMIIGPSALCREENPPILHTYAISTPCDEEYTKLLLNFACEFAIKNTYRGVTTDVFRTDVTNMAMLRSMGFHCSGSLPYGAYLKGQGYTESFLVFKAVQGESGIEPVGIEPNFIKKLISKL